MEISRRFMPLLMELGGWETDFCYRHVAPNGAPAFQRWLFNRAKMFLCSMSANRTDSSSGEFEVWCALNSALGRLPRRSLAKAG
jgi:hypothetical protein